MHALILVAAILAAEPAKHRLFESDEPTRSVAVTTAPANPVTAPAPIVVQFHEDAATKDDIRSLGDKITAAIQPLDHRLSAVERDVTMLQSTLRLVRQNIPRAPAKAELTKLYLTDASGVQCWGWEEAELRDRVARRNASFAARTTLVAPAVQYYAAPPALSYGGGCAGGSCR